MDNKLILKNFENEEVFKIEIDIKRFMVFSSEVDEKLFQIITNFLEAFYQIHKGNQVYDENRFFYLKAWEADFYLDGCHYEFRNNKLSIVKEKSDLNKIFYYQIIDDSRKLKENQITLTKNVIKLYNDFQYCYVIYITTNQASLNIIDSGRFLYKYSLNPQYKDYLYLLQKILPEIYWIKEEDYNRIEIDKENLRICIEAHKYLVNLNNNIQCIKDMFEYDGEMVEAFKQKIINNCEEYGTF